MTKPASTSPLILNQCLHLAFFLLCAAPFSNALITFQPPDKELCNILPNQTILEKNITIILAKNEKMITGSFQIDDPDHAIAEVYICQRENNSVPATSECLTMTPLRQVQIIKVNTTYMVTSELPKTWNCTNCVIQWILKQDATERYPVSKEYVKCYQASYSMSDKVTPDVPFIPTNGTDYPLAMHYAHYPMHHIPYAPYMQNYMWCGGHGWYSHVPGIQGWCGSNCLGGYCPGTHCACNGHCNVHTGFNYVPGMNYWCHNNCHWGYCPASHCNCLYHLKMPSSDDQQKAPQGPSVNDSSTAETGDLDVTKDSDLFKGWFDQRKAQQDKLKRQRLYIIQMYFK